MNNFTQSLPRATGVKRYETVGDKNYEITVYETRKEVSSDIIAQQLAVIEAQKQALLSKQEEVASLE